jgi:hypothetical protein
MHNTLETRWARILGAFGREGVSACNSDHGGDGCRWKQDGRVPGDASWFRGSYKCFKQQGSILTTVLGR